jgi:hypothetical protein
VLFSLELYFQDFRFLEIMVSQTTAFRITAQTSRLPRRPSDLKVCEANNQTAKYVKQNVIDLKGEIYSYSWKLQHPLSIPARTSRQNVQGCRKAHTTSQEHLTDTYTTPTTVQCTFFPQPP